MSTVVATPKEELIAEHEHLLKVLRSPSHSDDKKEYKKQAKELTMYKKASFICGLTKIAISRNLAFSAISKITDAEKNKLDEHLRVTKDALSKSILKSTKDAVQDRVEAIKPSENTKHISWRKMGPNGDAPNFESVRKYKNILNELGNKALRKKGLK